MRRWQSGATGACLRARLPRLRIAWLACLLAGAPAWAADIDAFAALDARTAEVELLALESHAASADQLAATFARVAERVPAQGGLPARPEDAAIGRISALTFEPRANGAAAPVYQDAHGVVLRDDGCRFVFATVAHFYFDVLQGAARVPAATIDIVVAGRRFAGVGIRGVLPEKAPAADANRTLRDIALLLVDKGQDCAPLPSLPLFAVPAAAGAGNAALIAPGTHVAGDATSVRASGVAAAAGSVWSMCPAAAPQRCGVVIVAAAEQAVDVQLPAHAMAYHSCSVRRGDSGCPLVVITASGEHRLLGLQTQGAPLAAKDGYRPVHTLQSASRAVLLGDRVRAWLDVLQRDTQGGAALR